MSRTVASRRILHQIGWAGLAGQNVTPLDVLLDFWRQELKMLPLRRIMNSSHHEGRRQVRVEKLNTTLGQINAVIYTDATQHQRQQYGIIVTTSTTNLLACASLNTEEMTAAEGAVIALALTQTGVRKVVTNSQQAYRNYQSCLGSRPALHVLKNYSPNGSIQLVWTPGHASIEGNEYAHQSCTFTPRAMELHEDSHPHVSYRDITQHYRLLRQTLPLP